MNSPTDFFLMSSLYIRHDSQHILQSVQNRNAFSDITGL